MKDYCEEVSELRPLLLRVARHQIGNAAWAEDAVSETMLAALERPRTEPHGASLKVWMLSILKHKLVDQIRRNTKEFPLDDDDDDSPVYPSATPQHDWPPGRAAQRQADPLDLLARKQTVQQLAYCLDSLTERQSRAIVLRDWLGYETPDICRELGINTNSLFVTLHRARGALRSALSPSHQSPAMARVAAVAP